jgi:hypothetical protein
MSKLELQKTFDEFKSRSERDFRCIKIGNKYVECIEYIAYETNSPVRCRFDLESIENEILQLDIIDDMNSN